MFRWGRLAVALACPAVAVEMRAQATVFWTGNSTASSNFDDAANWLSGAVPANNGTQVLGFFKSDATGANANLMTLDVSVNALGLDVEGDTGGANISLTTATGAALTLGASGIWINQSTGSSASVADIAVPIVLSASQTWSVADSNLTVSGAISGAGKALTLQNTAGLASFDLNSGASTFSGGLTVGGAAVLYAGASSSGPAGSPTSGPLGTGTVTITGGSELLAPAATSVTLGNDIVLGSGVQILGASLGGNLTVTGVISGAGALQAISSAGALTLDGANTYSGGSIIDFATLNVGNDQGVGTGPFTAFATTLNFTSAHPNLALSLVSLDQVTATFSASSHPTISNLTLQSSTLNFGNTSTDTINGMLSDITGSTNTINLGFSSTLDLNLNAPTDYYGTISGSNSNVVFGTSSTAVIDLHGANSYTGTTIDSNVLVIADNNAALGTGFVTLNGGGAALGIGAGIAVPNVILFFSNGSALEGYGSFSPSSSDFLNIAHGSVIVGGKGSLSPAGFATSSVPGTLTIGSGVTNLILGNQGVMQFSIMNATGTAGIDFSTIKAPFTLVNVTALAATPFTIQLVSVNPASGQVGLANFNTTMSYSWTLLSATSIGGFSSSAFTIDATTDFQNALGGGTFSIAEVGGNSLVLDFTPVPEPSTWALLAIGLLAAGTAIRRRCR